MKLVKCSKSRSSWICQGSSQVKIYNFEICLPKSWHYVALRLQSITRLLHIPGITINIRLPSKSYIRYNDLRYNDTPGLTMGMSLTKGKIFPVITIKSISLTT